MGNIVPSNGGNALAAYGGVNPWAEAARGVEVGAYLKFNGNDGRYSFGQDDDDLPVGSRVVGSMETLALGWICWVDSSVEEEVFVLVIDGKPPLEHELTDHGPYNKDDGWRSAASLSLVLESYGDDDRDDAVGTSLLWKTSTAGQVRSIQKLSGAYGRAFMQHPGEYPIIELGAESYTPKEKKHGKIKWSPNLKIVGWMTEAELTALAGADAGGGDDDDYEEPTPRSRREPEPEDEPAPRRGRREEPAAEEEPRRGRRQAQADDGEDEAPAPRRGRREVPADEEEAAPRRGRREAADEDEAPAPRRGRREAPADDTEDEAPAPRRGRREAPADDAEDEAPAPRRGRREASADDGEEDAPRGRSAPPANARTRRFD